LGKASRKKRELREQELPEKFAFGPEFLMNAPEDEWVDLVVHAGAAMASGESKGT
jgi:hypothetical protein